MTTDLLDDLRAIEQAAAAGGAADALLARAISRLTLLCMGVPVRRLDALLRAQQLIENGLTVKTACSRVGLSRAAFYRLSQQVRHDPCEPRTKLTASRR
jgi:hypothetical protein